MEEKKIVWSEAHRKFGLQMSAAAKRVINASSAKEAEEILRTYAEVNPEYADALRLAYQFYKRYVCVLVQVTGMIEVANDINWRIGEGTVPNWEEANEMWNKIVK